MTVWSDGCRCTFPDDGCAGRGRVYCAGCGTCDACQQYELGGCHCDCGGERDCPGCEACPPRDHRDDEPGWGEHWRDLGGEG